MNCCNGDKSSTLGIKEEKIVSLREDLKDVALDLGYSKVAITNAEKFPAYLAELINRHEMYCWLIEGPRQLMRGSEK